MLDRAGVRFVGDTHARQTADGRLALLPSDEMLDAERAGGIHTRSSSVCVPLTFRIGARAQTVRFGIGRHCSAGGRPGGAPGGPASRSG